MTRNWSKLSINEDGRVQLEKQEGSWTGVLQGIVCVTLGLAALRHALHVFGNVIHVGDVRPLLRVRVDAHIYQIPQLVVRMGQKEEKHCQRCSETRSHCGI